MATFLTSLLCMLFFIILAIAIILVVLSAGCLDNGYYHTINGTVKNVVLDPSFGRTEACYVSLQDNSVYGLRYTEDCAKIINGENISMNVYKRFQDPNDTLQWVVGVEVIP